MSRLPDLDYLTVARSGACRFTGDLVQLRAVSRAVASLTLGETCDVTLESTDSTIVIDGVAWEGIMCFGSYLLLQHMHDRRSYMLTQPGGKSDHHCRTVVFESTAESAEDGEGTTELRELVQQAVALQYALTAML